MGEEELHAIRHDTFLVRFYLSIHCLRLNQINKVSDALKALYYLVIVFNIYFDFRVSLGQ